MAEGNCPGCGGRGEVWRNGPMGGQKVKIECPACGGSGFDYDDDGITDRPWGDLMSHSAKRTCDRCRGTMPDRMARQPDGEGNLVCDGCKQGKAPTWATTGSAEHIPAWSDRIASDYIAGDRVSTEYGEGTVVESTGRSILIQLNSEETIRVQRGTPGFDRVEKVASTSRTARSTCSWKDCTNPVDWHVEGPSSGDWGTSVCDEHKAAAVERWSTTRAPARVQRVGSVHHHAHDSGDNAIINHCPFCGSGAVTGGSDGTVDCGYCHTVFTVQVQPAHPNMPQTIDGSPQPPPGMPAGNEMEMSSPVDPAVDEDASGAPTEALGDAEADPAEAQGIADPEAEQDAKGPVPPQFRKGSKYFTEDGEVLSLEKYINRLALDHADDRREVLGSVQASNTSEER